MLNFGLVFISLALTIGVNLEAGFLSRMGFQPDLLMVAALAFVITGLIVHRRLMLIVLVFGLIMGANLPSEAAMDVGYDPDILVAALFAVVTAPLITRCVDGFPA